MLNEAKLRERRDDALRQFEQLAGQHAVQADVMDAVYTLLYRAYIHAGICAAGTVDDLETRLRRAKRPEHGIATYQTVAAVADSYYAENREDSQRIYHMMADKVGGFPAIWTEVAKFAVSLDHALGDTWGEDREFIDDVIHATSIFIQQTLKAEAFPTAGSVVDELVKTYPNLEDK